MNTHEVSCYVARVIKQVAMELDVNSGVHPVATVMVFALNSASVLAEADREAARQLLDYATNPDVESVDGEVLDDLARRFLRGAIKFERKN